jgi:two-component system sensor histidine kinase KdpD
MQVVEEIGWRAGLAVEKARLFQDSERTRAELELSNRAKDEFLGIVSHELRTPITTIYGSSRFLKRSQAAVDGATKELLEGIESESAKMVQLVDSLLMLAKLEVGKALDKKPVELESVIAKSVESIQRSGRQVLAEIRTPYEYVEADPTYLEHILGNLLSNADKYSPSGCPITLAVEEKDGKVLFHIVDRGPGVDPAELELIFDSFYRSPRTSHLPGKGLGLAICKRLVEAQGGTIHARLAVGGGLEVVFSLPSSVVSC